MSDSGFLSGQIGTIEYLLKKFPDDLSPEVKAFMQVVLDRCYSEASEILNEPSEDIALRVGEILEARLTK